MRQFDTSPKINNRSFKNWLADQEVSVKSGYYQRRTNEFTRYFYFFPKNAKKHAIVFVHGTGNDALFPNFSYFQTILAKGWQLFSFDLDGHGRGNSTLLDSSTIWTCVDSAINELRNHCNQATAIHLIGESIGGLLAWTKACSSPPSVTSALCIATPFHLQLNSLSLLNELRSVTGHSLQRYRRRWGLRDSIPAFGPVMRTQFPIRLATARHGILQSMSYPFLVKSLLSATTFKKANVPKIPVYGIFGEHDLIAPVECIPQYFHQNRAHWHIIEKQTHFDMLLGESYLDLVQKILEQMERTQCQGTA